MNRNVNAFTVPAQSYWVASTGATDYPALEKDIKIDVAIVDGGLVGVTAARLLTFQTGQQLLGV